MVWVVPVVMAVFFHQAWSAADWTVGGPYAFSGLLLCLALACVWGRSLSQRRLLTHAADLLILTAGAAALAAGFSLLVFLSDSRGVPLLRTALFWAPVVVGYAGIAFHSRPTVVLLFGGLVYALLYVSDASVAHQTGQVLLTQGPLAHFAQPAVVSAIALVFGQVQGAVDEAQRHARVVEHISEADALTGLANRRRFRQDLDAALHDRRSQPVSLVMIDLDHFKQINDRYDHHMGDEVLKHFARTARLTLREADRLYRWGGEEFVLLLARTPLNDAGELAERLRERIGSERFAVPQRVTISLGVAEYLQSENADALFERADKALYQAKEAGRNRVRKAA